MIPGMRARLRVQGTRLLLDLDKRTHTRYLKDLLNVTFEQLPEPASWQLPRSTTVEAPAGPALRVTTTIDEWLPVDETDGDALVVIIVTRARDEIRRLG